MNVRIRLRSTKAVYIRICVRACSSFLKLEGPTCGAGYSLSLEDSAEVGNRHKLDVVREARFEVTLGVLHKREKSSEV